MTYMASYWMMWGRILAVHPYIDLLRAHIHADVAHRCLVVAVFGRTNRLSIKHLGHIPLEDPS